MKARIDRAVWCIVKEGGRSLRALSFATSRTRATPSNVLPHLQHSATSQKAYVRLVLPPVWVG